MAVLENESGQTTPIFRHLLPDEAKEGDRLMLDNGRWQVDAEGTRALREAVRQRMSRLRRKQKPGS